MDQNKNWQYDETVQLGTDYHSETEVQKYDKRMSQFRNFSDEAREILETLDFKENHNVLELGSGTGEIAIEIAKYCKKVYAVDISKTMLEYARKKSQARGSENIEFINSGFLEYTHSDAPLDIVISQIALHHLPDFWKSVALKRIYDMLKKGGKFYLKDVVFSFKLEKYKESINYTLDSFRKNTDGEMVKNFENHIKREYSTFDWIMEEMLYRAGFEINKADYRKDFITVYVCTKVTE